MNRILSSISIAILLFIPRLTRSQEIINGRGLFQIDADVAVFSGTDSAGYVEVYYGIRESILSYKIDSSRFLGAANMKLVVRNDSSVVAKKEWSVPHIIEDTSTLARSQTLMGIQAFGLPFGNYTVVVSAYDLNNAERSDSLTLPVTVRAFAGDKEDLSDIELCMSIQSSTNKGSMFYKNTLEVIPNASRLYGAGLPILYYYCEAYNLKKAQHQEGLVIRSAIVDALGKEVMTHDKPKPRTLNSSVEIGTMNLSSLRGGTYQFRASLVDSAGALLAQSSKKFFVYKPQAAGQSDVSGGFSDVTGSEYAVMSEAEVNQELETVRYISSEPERKQFNQLNDLDAKRKFLFEFWKRRDTDASTSENEFKQEYKKRIEYANKEYSSNFRDGWKTERGRVYVVYGPCDEVERFPSSSESNPYEIWHYNSMQGGVIFVFVDRTGLGDFVLVHSTHRDELHDDNWFQEYAQKMR